MSVRPGRRGVGALVGLASGAVLGAAIGFAAGSDPEDPIVGFSEGEKAGMMAVTLAPIGAIVGALVAPGEQCQVIPADENPCHAGCFGRTLEVSKDSGSAPVAPRRAAERTR